MACVAVRRNLVVRRDRRSDRSDLQRVSECRDLEHGSTVKQKSPRDPEGTRGRKGRTIGQGGGGAVPPKRYCLARTSAN